MKQLLINVMIIIGVACIISVSVFNFEPAFVFIEAASEKGNVLKVYEVLQAQVLLQKLQNVSSIDTAYYRVMFVFFVYDDYAPKCYEELQYAIVQNRDYSWVFYCIAY